MKFTDVDTVLTNVRQIVRKCPNMVLRRAYTRAMREWCQQTQWLRFNLPGVALAGQPTYTLGSDPNLDIVAIRAMSLTRTVGGTPYTYGLAASDSSTWNPNFKPAPPRQYCYIAEGGFSLYPTPDADYPLKASIVVIPRESMLPAANVPSDVLVKYSNDIEAGALAYLLNIPGEPWSNPQEAILYDRMFRASIANGKAEVQRSYNTGSVRVRPRCFVL